MDCDPRLMMSAAMFATRLHGDQKRRYTGEPYVYHCFEVARWVACVGGSDRMIVAAMLHDTVEDTDAKFQDIHDSFGYEVADLVYWLTDVSKPEDGNRETRKRIDRNHIAQAPADAKTIKLADLISNTSTIVQHDPDFAKVYLAEKRLALEVLTEGHPTLFKIAQEMATPLLYRGAN